MSSYYDSELIGKLKKMGIGDYTVISIPDIYIEDINKRFTFVNNRVDFGALKYNKYRESVRENISVDIVDFINELIQDNLCTLNESVVYIGDNLTENGYEFCLNDLLKILPYLLDEIPQHHYFLFKDNLKLLYISFENEIQFGVV